MTATDAINDARKYGLKIYSVTMTNSDKYIATMMSDNYVFSPANGASPEEAIRAATKLALSQEPLRAKCTIWLEGKITPVNQNIAHITEAMEG